MALLVYESMDEFCETFHLSHWFPVASCGLRLALMFGIDVYAVVKIFSRQSGIGFDQDSVYRTARAGLDVALSDCLCRRLAYKEES